MVLPPHSSDNSAHAYAYCESLVRDGDPRVAGFDRQSILDGVKHAIDDAGFDGCAHCASIMSKD